MLYSQPLWKSIWQYLLKFNIYVPYYEASLVAQWLQNLPAMQEMQIQSLGQEDPLEEGMATHSGILAWEMPWTEKPSRLQSMGSQRVGYDLGTNQHHLPKSVLSDIWEMTLSSSVSSSEKTRI